MFFRREKARLVRFDEYVEALRSHGFGIELQGSGRVKATRRGCAAIIVDDGGVPKIDHAGVAVGGEVALLVDGGYQKFLQLPNGRRIPALAEHLKALHDFEEDLKQGLGITSLYNQGLGTTFDRHRYDRLQDRDRGEPARPWEKPAVPSR